MAKKAVNLSIDAELLAKAKAARLNLSALLEATLSEQVWAEQERRWRQENKAAIDAANGFAEEQGIFGEDFRPF